MFVGPVPYAAQRQLPCTGANPASIVLMQDVSVLILSAKPALVPYAPL